MGFKCGIVGLPNVGKSTLFNALTETAAAQAANYPFCTIEPNVGEVAVPDPRLDMLAKLGKSEKIVPTRLTFVDIAGLVRGASKGEGLGNQFLANIREVDAIAHVVRCFEDTDVTHVDGQDRSDRRHRDHRDRIDAGRSRHPGKARRCAGEESQGQRQGGEGDARSREARARAAARGQAGAAGRAQAGGGKGLRHARADDGKAGALCLQCRGKRGRHRQRIFAQGRGARQGGGRGRRS